MTGENPNPSASNAPSAKILFSSVVIVSGGGSFLGYFFSSLVLKKSWLFAAIPIMNAVTWLFVCALITKSCLHDLRWDFRIPRAVGLFRYYYTIWFPFVLLSLPVGLWNENPLAGLVADLTYQVLGVVAYFVARVALLLWPRG